MFNDLLNHKKTISITGLGYVGLPLANAFSKIFNVIGYDSDQELIKSLRTTSHHPNLTLTSNFKELSSAHFHIIAVPTDIDKHKKPDLSALFSATKQIAQNLKRGDYVVYESTVYPGCIEEDCLPMLEELSELSCGQDFKLGYSPERIVPGSKEKTLENILKLVAGSDEEALDNINQLYSSIIKAGTLKVSSIKVAEAAKIIENTQRDLNISLINELSIIFEKMGLDTREVIEAAGTKWNFHKYYPGLVGGHCISVDPYYLIYKSRSLGIEPQIIAAGRRINDYMPIHIAKKLIQQLISQGKNPGLCEVLVLGISFKENVADTRNSKVFDLLNELKNYSVELTVYDPWVDPEKLKEDHKIQLNLTYKSKKYDAIIIAVEHDQFVSLSNEVYLSLLKKDGILYDLKACKSELRTETEYWCL